MIEEEYKELCERMKDTKVKDIISDPDENDTLTEIIRTAVRRVTSLVGMYCIDCLKQERKERSFEALMIYVWTIIDEILHHKGKENYKDHQIAKNIMLLSLFETVKYDLDKRIEKMKKLKETSNG